MKVRIEIDQTLTEPEIVIRAPASDAELRQLMQQLNVPDVPAPPVLTCYKGDTAYYLDLNDILFFETEDRQVNAHTADDIFEAKHRLYELENLLPGSFMRVSKSAILNVTNVFALTHSLSSNVVAFQRSHKQVYVSRRYYPVLKRRLEELEQP